MLMTRPLVEKRKNCRAIQFVNLLKFQISEFNGNLYFTHCLITTRLMRCSDHELWHSWSRCITLSAVDIDFNGYKWRLMVEYFESLRLVYNVFYESNLIPDLVHVMYLAEKSPQQRDWKFERYEKYEKSLKLIGPTSRMMQRGELKSLFLMRNYLITNPSLRFVFNRACAIALQPIICILI